MSDSTISRAYKMRVYPTGGQRQLLSRLFGARRWVWNWALDRRSKAFKESGERLNWVALSREFTVLRKSPERVWLAELPREPFNQVLRDLERAFTNFFAKRAAYPEFKSRRCSASVRFTLDQRRVQVHHGAGRWALLDLPGLGQLRCRCTLPLIGRLRSATLSRDAAGRIFVAITADGIPAPVVMEAQHQAIGIDAGLRDLAVIHNGESTTVVAAPKALAKHLVRLRRYQRRVARQLCGAIKAQGLDPTKPLPRGTRLVVSNRRRRMQARVNKLHARIADIRRDAQHQLSTTVVATAQVIAIEDLDLRAMKRGMGRRAFRRSVSDAGLGELFREIEYKAQWHHRTVVRVDRMFASSKTCSACGTKNKELKLWQRRWRCEACEVEHDRDENAAINIRHEGLRIIAGSSPATERSSERHARGADTATDTRTPVSVTAAAVKRELTSKAARPRTRKRCLEHREASSG